MYLKYNHLKLLHELITDVNKFENPALNTEKYLLIRGVSVDAGN